MIDLALLRIIKYKENFDKIHRYIPKSAIDKRTKAIIADIQKYYELNEDETKLDFPSFRSMFFTTFHKGMKKADCDYYNKLLTRMEADVPESIKKNIINQLLELEFATDCANLVEEYEQGEEIDIIHCIANLADKTKIAMESVDNWEHATLQDLEDSDEDATGYSWPIDCMNETYRNIAAGEQYIIVARPGKGKTTFLTHLNWSMSQNMPLNKSIIWFNNESRKSRILSRQIQSALNKSKQDLIGKNVQKEYIEAMGTLDRVKIYDIHGKTNKHLEDILEFIGIDNVGAIVVDMLDNVHFPTRADLREDQRLEQMYQWSRELGVKYTCPVFPTSQISNEGANLLFPTENMLKDSKTGKQGACDGIIMIGHTDDPLMATTRGISMPKTKSKREGMPDLREEVLLDADKGRYV